MGTYISAELVGKGYLWATATSGQEGKMKLFQVAESSKAEYCTRYDSKVGGPEDPTVEQLSAVLRKVRVLKQPPYCDFAVLFP